MPIAGARMTLFLFLPYTPYTNRVKMACDLLIVIIP